MIARLCVAMMVLGSAGIARAQTPSDELAAGREARSVGDHASALAHFATAWDRDSSALARAEMGLEELALGRFANAEAHLTEALALATGTHLEARRSELEAAVRDAASHLASLDIHCPRGCEVSLDGEVIGVTPLGHLVRVVEGSHSLEGTLADHERAQVSVDVRPGEARRVELAPRLIDRRPILERAGRAALQTIGIVGLAIGAAALAVGAVMVGLAVDRASVLSSAACAPTGACLSVRIDHELYRNFAFVTLIGGTVLAAVGAVFLAITPDASEDAPTVACGPAFELGASCTATF